jgi:hypothetical protein
MSVVTWIDSDGVKHWGAEGSKAHAEHLKSVAKDAPKDAPAAEQPAAEHESIVPIVVEPDLSGLKLASPPKRAPQVDGTS